MKDFILIKIILIIIYIISQIIYFILSLFGFLTNNTKKINKYGKNKFIHIFNLFLLYYFKNNMKLNGEIKITDKIDIIICNHYDYLDWIMISSLLNTKYNHKNINYIINKQHLSYLGGLGLLMDYSDDIFINMKLDTDYDIIINKLKNINNSFIIIYPEGRIFTEKNKTDSIKYCEENNLKPFNNLIYPKVKGLWIIINELKKQNKLGNLIDLTFFFENIKKRTNMSNNIFMSLKPLNKENYNIGDIYYIAKTYELNKYMDNYEIFKDYLIKIWRKKDKILDGENYKKLNYKTVSFNRHTNIQLYLLIFIILFVYCYLIYKTNYWIIPFSIFLIYIHSIILIKSKP